MTDEVSAVRGDYISEDCVPPRTRLEERLAAMWQARLNVTPIGVHDDFFELGGHSIAATQLLADIHGEFGVEVPARALFTQPTIAELALAIGQIEPETTQESMS
ncbi:phosphopantetheine-binding protein [Streptomyces sp. NPDC086077]|uniref:phosphopantetheine-binding protein n=1 Tax=Streptomyces sp. NPDC086077 TaxID=3154862 RepID=UPI00341ADADA